MKQEQLEILIAEQLSIRAIALRLTTSPTNVRWWLQKYGLRTLCRQHRTTLGKCRWHSCQKTNTQGCGSFCSAQCKNKFYVDRRRKELKKKAVTLKGGKCALCGYDRCVAALDFHHLFDKDFGISKNGHTMSWAKMEAELRKCILLCCRCHAEVHSGLHLSLTTQAPEAGIEPATL